VSEAPRIDYEAVARRMEQSPPRRRFEEPVEETCEVCGGWKGTWAPVHGRFCRCGRLVERGHEQLAAVDPAGEMRFDALEGGHPSLGRAARLALAAARGGSGRGVAMFGKPGAGKCVAGFDTLHLANGERVQAASLVGKEFELLGIVAGEIRPVKARAALNAIEPVWEIETETGRRIVRNAQHPLWMGEAGNRGLKDVRSRGWRPASEFVPGQLVAVADSLPAFYGVEPLPEDEIKLLAYMIGDGSLTQPCGRFTQTEGPQLAEMRQIAEAYDAKLVPHGRYDYRIIGDGTTRVSASGSRSGVTTHRVNRVWELMERHGLARKHSREKRVPPAIFRLPKDQLRVFLSRLFATDGWACLREDRNRTSGVEVGFCSASPGLVRDVQELLLKLGVHGRIAKKRTAEAWSVCVHATPMVLRFCEEVGIYGKEDAVETVRGVATQTVAEGPSRSAWRKRHAPPRTVWEKVASVRRRAAEPTVAVEVPGHHTYLSTFWEHNTHVAVAACREALRRGVVAGYYDVAGLVSRVQETYSPYETGTRRAVIEGVARRRFVVLDDLGKEHCSANVDSIFYELVNALYVGRSTLVLCSNLPDAEFRGRYDEAVRSRIAGMCEVVVVRGEDRRRG